jgi:hypothetical protein
VTRFRLRRIFWRGAAAVLVAAALVGLTAVLKGDFSSTDGRILGTLALLLYAGGALLSGLGLIERGRGRWLGAAVVSASPVALALMLLWVWTWVDESDHHWRLAWSSVLVLLAGLLAATALLLARSRTLERLAYAAAALATLAVTLSIAAIWAHEPGSGLAKALVAAWILAGLAWALVPVLRRVSAVATEARERVLGTLGDVELVVTNQATDALVLDVPRLAAGERLVLRRQRG